MTDRGPAPDHRYLQAPAERGDEVDPHAPGDSSDDPPDGSSVDPIAPPTPGAAEGPAHLPADPPLPDTLASDPGPTLPPLPPPGAPAAGVSRPSWTPPDAGAMSGGGAAPGGIHVELEDADVPPLPPPVRRRRRRRRALIAGAVLVVVGVPVGLAVAGTFPSTDQPSASGNEADGGDDATDGQTDGQNDGDTADEEGGEGAGDEDGEDGAGEDGAGDDEIDPPDLDALAGSDAVYGRLLIDIDASEQVMITFQDEVATVFSVPADSPDELMGALQEIGAAARDDLLDVRERLDDELDVDGAEEVRDRYAAHLDAWADYMNAVSADPSVLSGEGAGAGFNVVINSTADAFARALEERLPDDADSSVRDFAEDLLDRGFRGSGDSQV